MTDEVAALAADQVEELQEVNEASKSLLERTKLLELRAIKAEDERDIISTLLVSRCNDIEAKHLTLITELREKIEDLEAEKYLLMKKFQERIESVEKNRTDVVDKLKGQLADVEKDRDSILDNFRAKCKELEDMEKLYSQEAMDEKIKEIEKSKEKALHDYRKHLKSVETDRDYLINDLTRRFEKANQDLSYLIELIEKLLMLHQIRLAETENQRDVLIAKLKKRLAENQNLSDRLANLKALLATHGDAEFLALSKRASDAEFKRSLQGGAFPTIQSLSAKGQSAKHQLSTDSKKKRRNKDKHKSRSDDALDSEETPSLSYKASAEAQAIEDSLSFDMMNAFDANYLYLLAYNG